MSCFILYVGNFTQKYRIELQENLWIPKLQELRVSPARAFNAKRAFEKGIVLQPMVPHTEGVNILHLMCDDARIATWHNEGLPDDQMSIENAVILTNSSRWPLLIDPQL